MPPTEVRRLTPPDLTRREVTRAAAIGIAATVLPATSSHASVVVAPSSVVAETEPPVYRTGDRRLAYWAGGNTSTLTYPRSATSADASVAQAQHGSSQLGRSESTDGSVESNDDNRHWFAVTPTLRAVDGVVTPFDPTRSPYLFYSFTAASTQRLSLAALEFNLRQVFSASEYTVEVRTSVDGFATSLRTIRPPSSSTGAMFFAVNLSGHPEVGPGETVEFRLFLYDATSAGLRTIALSSSDSRSSPYDATLDTPDTSVATPLNYTTYAHLALFGRAIAVAA